MGPGWRRVLVVGGAGIGVAIVALLAIIAYAILAVAAASIDLLVRSIDE